MKDSNIFKAGLQKSTQFCEKSTLIFLFFTKVKTILEQTHLIGNLELD